ncbi:MAG TPA: hypothetical protein VGQ44_17215 [Gemmatimonadaceae bacterium]|jgi:hypothetical protein|nr:hypothetical protein [Gemmatimonadaceae bacterium]
MAQKTGTFDIGSLLAVRNLSAVKFGLSTVEQVLAADNEKYNLQVQQALTDLCDTSDDRQRVAGNSIGGDMQEASEYSRIPTQRDIPSYLIGFPLRKYQFAIGWTREWEKKKTPADFAISQQAAQGANLRRMRYEMQKAIYTPTNTSFVDFLRDKATLAVKAFINADSTAIPNGPNGEVFDGTTHTHYTGSATLTVAAAQALITNVVEHGFGGRLRIHINQADVAAWSGLTGFVPLQVPYVQINQAANQVAEPRLDITRLDNRFIGYFNAAEVWSKPWAPANYAFATDVSSPAKPLLRRTDDLDPQAGLHVEAELETFPLRAQYQENKFGFGVWNRLNGAVLQFNNASYSAPTLTF